MYMLKAGTRAFGGKRGKLSSDWLKDFWIGFMCIQLVRSCGERRWLFWLTNLVKNQGKPMVLLYLLTDWLGLCSKLIYGMTLICTYVVKGLRSQLLSLLIREYIFTCAIAKKIIFSEALQCKMLNLQCKYRLQFQIIYLPSGYAFKLEPNIPRVIHFIYYWQIL